MVWNVVTAVAAVTTLDWWCRHYDCLHFKRCVRGTISQRSLQLSAACGSGVVPRRLPNRSSSLRLKRIVA